MTSFLWFKRDLRIHDHPALSAALATGDPVLPVYIVEPAYWALPDTSERQWEFTKEAVLELREQFRARQSDLLIRTGEVVEELAKLAREARVTRIFSHEEIGNAWTYARDLRVKAWAASAGIDWVELPQTGVFRCQKTRARWASRRDAFMAEPVLAAPSALPPVAIDPGALPDLDLVPDPCPDRQTGGRGAAEELLQSFLNTRGKSYRRAMSTPLEGEHACSRLSPYLALGVISGREVEHATKTRRDEARRARDGWTPSLKSFSSRLAWRDHFAQKLEDEPDLEIRALHSAYDDLRPAEANTDLLAAWQMGETGVPFVDACMRYLAHSGWLNFRMRAMVMSFASYHLWLDWRASGAVLARRFTDYDPGIHWPQTQMQSGTTGINTVRIYNPVKQGHDQDPKGIFTRRWVPELAQVPDEFLQEPWRWDGPREYPEPVVDLKSAAKAAREKVWAVRKGDAFWREAETVVEKHASRKDRQGRFVNDRARTKGRHIKRRPGKSGPDEDRQLKLDL